jgi:signal peptidase II
MVAATAAMAIGAADLLTKWLVQSHLAQYERVPLIGDYVRLTHIYNPGAAFGISLGSWSRPLFIVLTLAALVALGSMLAGQRSSNRAHFLALTAIAGGALGNLANRIVVERGVVDWIDVGIGAVRWPVFNLADIAITCGAVLLAVSLWREDSGPRATTESGGRTVEREN